jgi:hypothetical protein
MPREKMSIELLEKLSLEARAELYNGVHEVMYQAILRPLKDTMNDPWLTEEEIQAARRAVEFRRSQED